TRAEHAHPCRLRMGACWRRKSGHRLASNRMGYRQRYHRRFERRFAIFAIVPCCLHPLRDVENDLRNIRQSPLAKLIEASAIDDVEQAALVAAIQHANDTIEVSPTIQAISGAIDAALKEITGPAFSLDVELGLSAASFQS